MRRVYLAGPIWKARNPNGWRKLVAGRLPADWQAVNPLDIEVFEPGCSVEQLVTNDLEAISRCDAVLALVNAPSWGTAMEIRFAFTWGIPVIGWCPELTADHENSPWLTFHCALITPKLEDVEDFLREIPMRRLRHHAQG